MVVVPGRPPAPQGLLPRDTKAKLQGDITPEPASRAQTEGGACGCFDVVLSIFKIAGIWFYASAGHI